MGTAILRPHDCLRNRFLPKDALAIHSPRVRSRRNSTPNFNSYANQNRRRKRSPVATFQAIHHDRRRSGDRSTVPEKCAAAANLFMGQVTILKRGEKLSTENRHAGIAVPTENYKVMVMSEEGLDLFLGSTNRLGPDAVTIQKQIRGSDPRDGIYAGSAFSSSPPPSSVPVPLFLMKYGAATSDLRRLLRLDLE